MNFKIKARINRSDAGTILRALDQLAAKGSVTTEGDGSLSKPRWKEPARRN